MISVRKSNRIQLTEICLNLQYYSQAFELVQTKKFLKIYIFLCVHGKNLFISVSVPLILQFYYNPFNLFSASWSSSPSSLSTTMLTPCLLCMERTIMSSCKQSLSWALESSTWSSASLTPDAGKLASDKWTVDCGQEYQLSGLKYLLIHYVLCLKLP